MTTKIHVAPERVQILLERVTHLYEESLAGSADARTWLTDHGVGSRQIDTHRIGWCDGTLHNILPADGKLEAELVALGVLDKALKEHFLGCLTFPLRDTEGRVCSLCGIRLPSAHPVLLPRLRPGIWNVVAVRTNPMLFVTAAVLDALSIESAGNGNVIAMPDSRCLTARDLAVFAEHRTAGLDFVVVGQCDWTRVTNAIGEVCGNAWPLRLRVFPRCAAPQHLLKQRGPAALAAWLAAEATRPAAPAAGTPPGQDTATAPAAAAALRLAFGSRQYEIIAVEKADHTLRVTVRVSCTGKLHLDTVDLYNARSRRAFVRDLALALDQPHEILDADVFRLIDACLTWTPPRIPTPEAAPAVVLSPEQRAEAEAFGGSPRLIDAILDDYAACGLVGEESNKLLCYLAAVSRKLDTPLSVLLLASSGAGKSAIQAATLALCPEEDVVRLTSLTRRALFYRDEGSLRHRVLAIEEGAGAQDADYAIRCLISAGELAVESVVRDSGSGMLRAVDRRVCGPVAVFCTVTSPHVDPETRSRFFVIGVDESRSQTARILADQRARQTLDGFADELRVQAIREKHRSFQRLLRPLAVVNPYASRLVYADDRLQARRDQPRYLNLIRAVAFLRQMRKDIRRCSIGGRPLEYITVDEDDIRTAGRLAMEILGTSLDDLSPPALDLLAQTGRMLARPPPDGGTTPGAAVEGLFTRRELREFTGWSRTRLHTYLSELIDLEYIVVAARLPCRLQQYRLLYAGQGQDGARFMPGMADLETVLRGLAGESAAGDPAVVCRWSGGDPAVVGTVPAPQPVAPTSVVLAVPAFGVDERGGAPHA